MWFMRVMKFNIANQVNLNYLLIYMNNSSVSELAKTGGWKNISFKNIKSTAMGVVLSDYLQVI